MHSLWSWESAYLKIILILKKILMMSFQTQVSLSPSHCLALLRFCMSSRSRSKLDTKVDQVKDEANLKKLVQKEGFWFSEDLCVVPNIKGLKDYNPV